MLNVKKITKTAKLPEKAHSGDAGFDLFSDIDLVIPSLERDVVKTGISLKIDPPKEKEYSIYLRIAPRSGLSVKKGIDVFAGVVDIGYTGEIMISLFNSSKEDFVIKKGDKIAQIIPTLILKTQIKEVDGHEQTERGDKGWGSSDRVNR